MAIQVLRNAVGVRGNVKFPRKRLYGGLCFNVISFMRVQVDVGFTEKKYIT